MVAPLLLVLELGHADVENGKDQVVALERRLARQERVELVPALRAADRRRRDDRDEEHRLADAGLDLRFPQRAGRDRFLVLPEAEIHRRAPELPAQLALDALAQRRQRSVGIQIVLARIAEEANELGVQAG